MTKLDHRALAEALLAPMLEAAAIELAYLRSGVEVERKADSSPVTAADREAEAVILAALARISPGAVVVAEEDISAQGLPARSENFFLVDPLDGTRDFVAGTEDFTINVALAERGIAVFGMILAPARGELYATLAPGKAMMAEVAVGGATSSFSTLRWRTLACRPQPTEGLVAVSSPWRPPSPVDDWLASYKVAGKRLVGSSYKFCVLARGDGDVYPQIGATHEWDTAAGQAILEAAGGHVARIDGGPLVYGKHAEGYLNPPFVAWGCRP